VEEYKGKRLDDTEEMRGGFDGTVTRGSVTACEGLPN